MELKSTHSEIFTWIIHVYIIIFHLNREELLESPRRHPDPSPACLLTSEGLERALFKSQFFTPLKFKGDRVQNYQEFHSTAKSREEMFSTTPLWTYSSGS